MFTLISKSVIVFCLIFLILSFSSLVSASDNIKWINTLNGGNDDEAYCVVEAYDGGFALAGITNSFKYNNYDFWLIKTDSDGILEWNMTYGEENEYDGSLVVDNNDNYWIACIQQPIFGDGHFWLLETSLDGSIKSNQTYTTSAYHSSISIINTNNGNLAIVYSSRDSGEYRDITLIILENVKLNSMIPIILGVMVIFLIILFLVLYFKRKKYHI